MEIITRQMRADKTAEQWKETYYVNGSWRYGEDKICIYRKLVILGKHPNPDDVDGAIGNASWTELMCDECNEYVEKVIRVGGDPDNGSACADLCEDCVDRLQKAFKEK